MIDVLLRVAGPLTITGTTIETPFFNTNLPPNVMGKFGQLRINMAYSHNLNVNNKTFKLYVNGAALWTDVQANATAGQSWTARLSNRGATNSQMFTQASEVGTAAAGLTYTTGLTFDTTLALNVQMTALLAVGTDSAVLDDFCIELLRPPGG